MYVLIIAIIHINFIYEIFVRNFCVKKTITKTNNMADRAIRVAVFEGDFASLCALGFPLSLGVQLQQSYLKLSEAQWSARSSSGGVSVSCFWPAPENMKVQPKKKKRKRRHRGKAKAQSAVATHTFESPKPSTSSAINKPAQDAISEAPSASNLTLTTSINVKVH